MSILGGIIHKTGLVRLGGASSPDETFGNVYQEQNGTITGGSSATIPHNIGSEKGSNSFSTTPNRAVSSITLEHLAVHLTTNSRPSGEDWKFQASNVDDDTSPNEETLMLDFATSQTGMLTTEDSATISMSKGTNKKWVYLTEVGRGSTGSIEGNYTAGLRFQ